jgi:hypothetical protein
MDEVFVRINGKTHYLWRAVDHEGEVLEVFATKRRNWGLRLSSETGAEALWPARHFWPLHPLFVGTADVSFRPGY